MARKHLNKYARRYGLTSAAIVLMAAAIGSGTSVQAQERYLKNLEEIVANFPKVDEMITLRNSSFGNHYSTYSIRDYLHMLEQSFQEYFKVLNKELELPGPAGPAGPA
ncbi:TPA: cell surface protein, partial [Streptococcus equi subsp. zooepidemicus]|nr:cell surface protein [Streptococcus equi subsp. zooepidemicus]